MSSLGRKVGGVTWLGGQVIRRNVIRGVRGVSSTLIGDGGFGLRCRVITIVRQGDGGGVSSRPLVISFVIRGFKGAIGCGDGRIVRLRQVGNCGAGVSAQVRGVGLGSGVFVGGVLALVVVVERGEVTSVSFGCLIRRDGGAISRVIGVVRVRF